MNILLVFPNVFINLNEPTHFPAGIAYVSSFLKSKGHRVFTLNLNFEKGDLKDILERHIKANDIKVVETGSLITHYHFVKEIIDCVKEIDGTIYTVLGGGVLTSAPEVVMQGISNADFGIFGEGEITNHELLRALKNEISLSEVDGLIYRDKASCSNTLIKNKPREEIKDLDSMPWPDYEGFSLDKMLQHSPKRYVTLSTGRSCAYRCTFCFHTSGQTYRQRSLDSFFKELDYLVEKYGIDNIYITDELFACDPERLQAFCDRIKNYNILWAVQLRVDIVTKELLQILKDSGCIILSLGLESADNTILKSMNKKTTAEQIENALKYSLEVGISAHGGFIFGDINETKESVQKTLSWWKSHRQYNTSLDLIQIYPGTALYKYGVLNNIIKDELKFIEDGCPYINVSKLSDEEYKALALEIVEIQTIHNYPLKNIKITKEDKKRLRMDVVGECAVCGKENELKYISMTRITNSKCNHCEESFHVSPYQLYENSIRSYLAKMFETSNSLAFWGAGVITHELFCLLSVENKERCMIVDPNNLKAGTNFGDKTVLSADALYDDQIDTVIVSDYVFERYITNVIRSKYKNIKNIVGVSNIIRETETA